MGTEYVRGDPIDAERNVWHGQASDGTPVVLKGRRASSRDDALLHELTAIVETHNASAKRTGLTRSPHVVQALGFTVIENNGYIVLENAGNRSIRDLASSKRSLFAALAQTADALAHVHFADMRHYDMKPTNVMINADGSATLIDLGSCAPRNLFDLQGTLGSVGYASSKVLLGFADPRADTFSLGASTFQILTGKTIYDVSGGHLRAILNAQRGHFRPWPVIPGVSKDVMDVLKRSTTVRNEDGPSLKEMGAAFTDASQTVQ